MSALINRALIGNESHQDLTLRLLDLDELEEARACGMVSEEEYEEILRTGEEARKRIEAEKETLAAFVVERIKLLKQSV